MEHARLTPDREYLELFYRVYTEVCEKSRLEEAKEHIQHGDTSVYEHSINVAYSAMCMAIRLGRTGHLEELIRGALLHDYFLYDWHEKHAGHNLHGFYHPGRALENALQHFDMTRRERMIIKRHMFPLTPVPPTYTEAYLVCLADKICSVQETLHAGQIRKRFLQIILEARRWRVTAMGY